MTATPQAPITRTSVQGIREELRRLWASEAMSDQAVIRARTHNLVVIVADDVSAEQTTHRVIERTGERPGRVIVIDIDHKQKEGLDAWVTTYCRTVNKHQICGEMITLTVHPDKSEELHSTVISLLAPDLPVYLWWSGVPDPDDHLFAHLAPEADRILVDSDTFEDAAAGFARIAQLQEWVRIGDLAWARLSPWRQLIAQLWDVPDMAEVLGTTQSIDLHVKPAGPENPGRSLLLLGWLAARLGWSADTGPRKTDSGVKIHWSHPDGEGQATVSEDDHKSLSPGDIHQIAFSAGKGKDAIRARLESHPETASVETTVEHGGNVSMTSTCRLRRPDDAMALAEELDLGYDPSYAAAVQAAAHFLRAG